MRLNKFKCLIILISLGLIACTYSNPYRSGKIEMIIKDNNPCFYINYNELKGNYDIVIKDQDNNDYWDYKGIFEKSYPKKENCILFNKESFGGLKDLNFNRKYNVTLSNLNAGFSNEFCLRKAKKHVILQKIIGDQCVDIQETEEDKLRNFFKKIF